jgi:hypothetical protein
VVASLAAGGVLLLAMFAASGWGGRALAADARIPVHCGSVEHCFRASKRTGLIIWPALGAAAFALLGGIAASHLAAGWVPGVRDTLLPAVMCVLLGFQAGALLLARSGGPGAGSQVRSD